MSYQYIKPSQPEIDEMQKFRDKFETLHKEIEKSSSVVEPTPRGVKICLRKLEEANFWLNKAITKND